MNTGILEMGVIRIHVYADMKLQSNLSWNRHIDPIAKKGNSMLGFLQRNLKVSNEDTNRCLLSPCEARIRVLLHCMEPYTQDATQTT